MRPRARKEVRVPQMPPERDGLTEVRYDPAELDSHFHFARRALESGNVVPFLGAGVNTSARTVGQSAEGRPSLPSGKELTEYLATESRYPEAERDLLRVSQFFALEAGKADLYETLHRLFSGEHEPSPTHRLLAALPQMFRQHGQNPHYQLILTTNYDCSLERAFDDAGERYHLLWYVSEGEFEGKFMHLSPGSVEARLIAEPNEDDVSTDDCTVIIKVHGGVGVPPILDSYVITEDDYLDYLTHSTEVASLFPIRLAEELLKSQFLFLGYSLRDWNLRVILTRIWREQHRTVSRKSWAIQNNPTKLDLLFWADRKVEIVRVGIDEYVESFRVYLGLPGVAAAVGTP